MARIVVVGAGLGGVPTAYELRHRLAEQHQIVLISNAPQFTFLPSLPWVGLDLTPLQAIQLEIAPLVTVRGIELIVERVNGIDPFARKVNVGTRTIDYDYIVIATGAELALDAVPGLGPENGFTQSICNPHHALMARQAWQEFLLNPGPLLVGAVPGASCMGPVYEFALLADFVLRKRGLRQQVPITIVTPEPYLGQLGIGEMANSTRLVTRLLEKREIAAIANGSIASIAPNSLALADGRVLPFQYSMLLPPFRGPKFLREAPGLTDAQGFLPVLPTYRHPNFPSIYSVGVITQLASPEETPLPVGVPKTGQMTEAMAMAVAHNITIELGAIEAEPVTPTLEAICFADFGDTGILFLADPVLPDPITGRRRRAIALAGPWVGWLKKAFEQYFLAKMRWGMAVPWFERLCLKGVGLSLVEPIADTDLVTVTQ